ncbi:MAG: PD-(D/E)XK nuclease family protein, partial [Thermodesulfovibrionales bacterium]|nr:PD-(D/E)XK nuclease family protein [Thermodesulfovibrionales bacterium]
EFNPLEKASSLENAMDNIELILTNILDELLNPDIPFYPTKNFKENCQYCDFRTVCGTLWVKARD